MMGHDDRAAAQRARRSSAAERGDLVGGSSPGKRTLVEQLAYPAASAAIGPAPAVIQRATSGEPRAAGDEDPRRSDVMDRRAPRDIQRIAAHGVDGAAQPLPHFDRIQALFGRHDVRGVRAQVGGAAAEAASAIGAEAYATGNQVAFTRPPDLHTAAHEAAHVVQQTHGVNLYGGMGVPGDAFEHHADAVADAVVGGQSAEPLLDAMPRGGVAAGPAVQAKFMNKTGPIPQEKAREDIGKIRLPLAHHDRLLRLNDEEMVYDWDEQLAKAAKLASPDSQVDAGWVFKQLEQWYAPVPVTLRQVLEEAGAAGGGDAIVRAAVLWIKSRVTVKQVSENAAPRLTAAQRAIGIVKNKLAYGAGNQLLSLLTTGGNSAARSNTVKSKLVPVYDKFDRSGGIAAAAEIGQSGTCREYASVMYHVLVDQLGIQPCSIVKGAVDHTFVVIGDLARESASELVAADAWPTISQACLLEDHFAYRREELGQGSATPSGPEEAREFTPSKIAVALSEKQDLSTIMKMTFAPGVTRGLTPVAYLYEEQTIVDQSFVDRPPAQRTVSEETKRLESLSGKSGGSIKNQLTEIESAFLDDEDEEQAFAKFRELAERFPEQKAAILECARELDKNVGEWLQSELG